MIKLRQLLAAILMALVIGVDGFAQKNDNDRRPPKEGSKVKEGNKRPPPNTSQGNNNKHGRPK